MSYLKVVNGTKYTLYGMIGYITENRDTYPPLLLGVGINPDFAYEEMTVAKQIFNQTDGRPYKQLIFSFDADIDLTQDELRSISYEIASFFKNEYQILMSIHFDTVNTHIHYVMNSVNIRTEKKLQMSKQYIYHFKRFINEILERYQLSPIDLYEASALAGDSGEA